MPNLYYSPEHFGLTVIGDIEWSSGSWEFDTTVVFRHEDGSLAYAEDSGCSCPEPFGNLGPDDLTVCTPAELQAHLESRQTPGQIKYDGDRSAQIADLMLRIIQSQPAPAGVSEVSPGPVMQQRVYLVTIETAEHDADLLAAVPAIIRARLAGTALHVTDIQSQP